MKFILDEAILREDATVFDLEDTAEFPRGVESFKTATEILGDELSDGDITDKTEALKNGIREVETEIINGNYAVRSMDIAEYETEFTTEVLGFHPYGPELHYDLTDFGIELVFKKDIDFTSGVIPPIKEAPSRERRDFKHIVHKKMSKAILIGGSKLYIRRIGSFIVSQLLMDGVSAEAIIEAIDHLWLFEHISKIEDITKEIRKYSLEYKFARNWSKDDDLKQIKNKLAKLLDGMEWTMICRHDGDSQKSIITGKGLTQELLDGLEENDFYINSFKITDSDI